MKLFNDAIAWMIATQEGIWCLRGEDFNMPTDGCVWMDLRTGHSHFQTVIRVYFGPVKGGWAYNYETREWIRYRQGPGMPYRSKEEAIEWMLAFIHSVQYEAV